MAYSRREHQRIPLYHPAELFLDNRVRCVAKTQNISMGGLGVVAFKNLRPKIQGQIKMIYNRELLLQIAFEVMWCKRIGISSHQWLAGLRFETMSASSRSNLIHLIIDQMQKKMDDFDLAF